MKKFEGGNDAFLTQETEAKRAIYESLRSGKVVILGAESSIPNQIYLNLGDKVNIMKLEDGSTGFYSVKLQSR